MNRRRFLQRSAAGSVGLWLCRLSGAEAADADAELLEKAKDRIKKHRLADGIVVVRDSSGKAVPGAEVKIEQVRHKFLFGCNFFMFDRIRNADEEAAYREQFAALLNFATLGFYWPAYEREKGKPTYEYTGKVAEWCGKQGIACKGHPLVWDYADPRWLPREFAEIEALSEARVKEIVSRFKGQLDIWDVVNEPTHLGRFNTRMGEWAISLGAVPYVARHLKIARAANPGATLLVNDYRTDPEFYKILDALRDGGKLLYDVIGIQSHMHGGPWPLRRIWEVCDAFAKLGVPLHFTETTVVSGTRIQGERWNPTTPEGEALQAEYVPKFYTMLFAHPAVEALTWWDFSDQGAWQGAPAGFIRRDMSPKPVYEKLKALIRGEWWTNVQGRTNQDGQFTARACCGTHRVSAQAPGGQRIEQAVKWERGSPNRFELKAG